MYVSFSDKGVTKKTLHVMLLSRHKKALRENMPKKHYTNHYKNITWSLWPGAPAVDDMVMTICSFPRILGTVLILCLSFQSYYILHDPRGNPEHLRQWRGYVCVFSQQASERGLCLFLFGNRGKAQPESRSPTRAAACCTSRKIVILDMADGDGTFP